MTDHGSGASGAAVWVAGLVVVVAAGAATAHGLYEVALGSRAPAGIAWLYPVITDGLALVAYAATTRLVGPGRRYAWSVVVLAAGLSGLAQATHLAGAVGTSPVALRFGVGAWPAVAAAIAAHLLFLIGTTRSGLDTSEVSKPVQPSRQPMVAQPQISDTTRSNGDQAPRRLDNQAERTGGMSRALSPRNRALTTAQLHARQNGSLPTVRELEALAQVSRGTAATALQELKATRKGLHLIDTPTTDEAPDR